MRLTGLNTVCDISGHATIGQIYHRVKELDSSIDQSTVYHALDVCEVGLVNAAAVGEDGKGYEIAGKTFHHHLVYQQSGTVSKLVYQFTQHFFKQIEYQTGFLITDNHPAMSAICGQCANTGETCCRHRPPRT